MNDAMETPEGALIGSTLKHMRPPKSGRTAAKEAGISEGRWRQIVSGYASMGHGRKAPVVAPALTLARMARTVGLTPDDLQDVGREDAAVEMLRMESDVSDALGRIESHSAALAEQDRMQNEQAQLRIQVKGRDVRLSDASEDQLLQEIRRRLIAWRLKVPGQESQIADELAAARERRSELEVSSYLPPADVAAREGAPDTRVADQQDQDAEGPGNY